MHHHQLPLTSEKIEKTLFRNGMGKKGITTIMFLFHKHFVAAG